MIEASLAAISTELNLTERIGAVRPTILLSSNFVSQRYLWTWFQDSFGYIGIRYIEFSV